VIPTTTGEFIILFGALLFGIHPALIPLFFNRFNKLLCKFAIQHIFMHQFVPACWWPEKRPKKEFAPQSALII
jgi:hypothetical protein